MEELPFHLQLRIYVEAGVSGICTTSRDEVLRALLLADQRDINEPFVDGDDGPAPRLTWRLANMPHRPPESEAQTVAALHCIGRRLHALRHISVDVTRRPRPPHSIFPGLNRFAQHVAPLLTAATRLTLRGVFVHLPGAPIWHAWPPLSTSPLGAACTRLDVTSDERSIANLLATLTTAFPAVQDVRVRVDPDLAGGSLCHPASVAPLFTLHAPDSLARLLVLLSPGCSRDGFGRLHCKTAQGLQELVLRFVHPPPPPPPSAASGGRGGGGGRRRRASPVTAALSAPETAHHCTLLVECELPALHTLRGFCRAPAPAESSGAPVLRHFEAAFVRSHGEAAAYTVAPDPADTADVRSWLASFDRAVAPSLATMCLRVTPRLDQEDSAKLLAWGAVRLHYGLTLVP